VGDGEVEVGGGVSGKVSWARHACARNGCGSGVCVECGGVGGCGGCRAQGVTGQGEAG